MPPRDQLADLSDSEFVRAILTELDRRPTFEAVRDQLATLLSMGPTLTAVTEAGVGQLVEQALAAARAEIAEQNVVLSQPLFTAVEVAEAVGARGSSNRVVASRLRSRGEIVGLEVQGRFLFPAFQFDVERARVHPVVAEVNRQVTEHGDGWAVARWWMTTVEGHAPVGLIDDDPELLRARAALFCG